MLKGRINNEGTLFIKRRSKERKQKCPYATAHWGPSGFFTIDCNDHCPHFGEPYESPNEGEAGINDPIILNVMICSGTILRFASLTDERE